MENFIQVKREKVLKFGILDSEGKETGEYIEFDLEDLELPLRLQECDKQHKQNLTNLRNQFLIIEKKEDKKGKYLLSWKEEEKLKVMKEFYDKEIKSLDLFLGEGGTNKMLCGSKPYFSMFEDISNALEPILPKIKQKSEDIVNKIKNKYQDKQGDIIE